MRPPNLPTHDSDCGREKARIPAWCDRILRKGDNLRQINYNTAPLRFSDHRPVYATFQCTISMIDESQKESLVRQIYRKRRKELADTRDTTRSNDVDDEELLGYESIAPGLPPASSDRRKWWLDNSMGFLWEIHAMVPLTDCIEQVYRQGLDLQNLLMAIRSTLRGPRIPLSLMTNRTGLLRGLHRNPRTMLNLTIRLESTMGIHEASLAVFHHHPINRTTAFL